MAHKIKTRIARLLAAMTEGLWEKNHIMALALLSSVAGESIFLLGPPGTAKSMVARRLKAAWKNAISFEYLMSRFSTPDEVFGPVSIARLKNDDVYERRTEGYLPEATVVFLDEIWKAGPAIQNALLTVINEKIFQNGRDTLRVPLQALIAASNELPAEDEGLEAIWDRFVVRVVSNCITDEETFYRMICEPAVAEPVIDSKLQIDEPTLCKWREEYGRVEIPQRVLSVITSVRKGLKAAGEKEGMNPEDFYVSDRRWRKVAGLMRVSAFLNGRDAVDLSDMLLLNHSLWNRAECIPEVLTVVTDALFADITAESAIIEEDLDRRIEQASPGKEQETMKADAFKVYNYFYLKVVGYPSGVCYLYRSDYEMLSAKADTPGVLFRDDNQGAYIVSRNDSSGPFASLPAVRNGKMVKLRAVAGGLSIDGEKYPIELRNGGAAIMDAVEMSLGVRMETLRKRLEERMDEIEGSGNLFVSDDDVRLVRAAKKIMAKKLRSLELRVKSMG
ncbi:MAG: AAA domain-containing protein [Bacteroides sp.]|nr:AAA domain-containing protein [Bacteroides sp.]MBD5375521.1 AAA domain-containing protein [Bacteroides sp.]